MRPPDRPADEEQRLSTLHALGLLDTAADERFDAITRTAAELFGTPISLISLVDSDRQWFKSRHGLTVAETPRDVSFCGHAILDGEILVVEDALKDPRFHDNPLVTDAPHIRFYAGRPLAAPNGQRIGTLCVIDRRSRALDAAQNNLLNQLGAWAEAEVAVIAERRSLPRYLDHLLGLLADPVLLADASERVRFANAAALRLLRYGPNELSGLPLLELVDPGEQEQLAAEIAALARAAADFASLERSATVRCRDGTLIRVMLTLSRRIAVGRSVTTVILRQ